MKILVTLGVGRYSGEIPFVLVIQYLHHIYFGLWEKKIIFNEQLVKHWPFQNVPCSVFYLKKIQEKILVIFHIKFYSFFFKHFEFKRFFFCTCSLRAFEDEKFIIAKNKLNEVNGEMHMQCIQRPFWIKEKLFFRKMNRTNIKYFHVQIFISSGKWYTIVKLWIYMRH